MSNNNIEIPSIAEQPSNPVESMGLLDSIMDVVQNTPQKLHGYFCHGDYHSYRAPDYETIRERVSELLSNVTSELPKSTED